MGDPRGFSRVVMTRQDFRNQFIKKKWTYCTYLNTLSSIKIPLMYTYTYMCISYKWDMHICTYMHLKWLPHNPSDSLEMVFFCPRLHVCISNSGRGVTCRHSPGWPVRCRMWGQVLCPRAWSQARSVRVPVRKDTWPVCRLANTGGFGTRTWQRPSLCCLCDSQGLARARHPNDVTWHVLGGSGGAEKWNSPQRVTNHEYNEVRAVSSVSKWRRTWQGQRAAMRRQRKINAAAAPVTPACAPSCHALLTQVPVPIFTEARFLQKSLVFVLLCKQSSPMKRRWDLLAFSANASSFVKDIIRCCHTRGIKYPWLCKQDQTVFWTLVGRTPPVRQCKYLRGFAYLGGFM